MAYSLDGACSGRSGPVCGCAIRPSLLGRATLAFCALSADFIRPVPGAGWLTSALTAPTCSFAGASRLRCGSDLARAARLVASRQDSRRRRSPAAAGALHSSSPSPQAAGARQQSDSRKEGDPRSRVIERLARSTARRGDSSRSTASRRTHRSRPDPPARRRFTPGVRQSASWRAVGGLLRGPGAGPSVLNEVETKQDATHAKKERQSACAPTGRLVGESSPGPVSFPVGLARRS